MSSIIVKPGNPHDFSGEELDDLRRHLAQKVPDADVVVESRDERGYGVTLYEVVQVVADIRGAGGDYVIAAVVLWMRRRWKRDKQQGRAPRPRSVIILDSEGNKIRSYDIDEPDGEAVEASEDDD